MLVFAPLLFYLLILVVVVVGRVDKLIDSHNHAQHCLLITTICIMWIVMWINTLYLWISGEAQKPIPNTTLLSPEYPHEPPY